MPFHFSNCTDKCSEKIVLQTIQAPCGHKLCIVRRKISTMEVIVPRPSPGQYNRRTSYMAGWFKYPYLYIYIYSLYIHHIHFIIFIIIYSNHSKRWNQSDRLKSYPIYHPLSLSTICTCNIYIYKYWHIVNTAGLNWFRKCFRSPNSVP